MSDSLICADRETTIAFNKAIADGDFDMVKELFSVYEFDTEAVEYHDSNVSNFTHVEILQFLLTNDFNVIPIIRDICPDVQSYSDYNNLLYVVVYANLPNTLKFLLSGVTLSTSAIDAAFLISESNEYHEIKSFLMDYASPIIKNIVHKIKSFSMDYANPIITKMDYANPIITKIVYKIHEW